MGDNVQTKLDKRQVEAVDEMIEDGRADSRSEACRTAANAGLVELGYLNGRKSSYLTWLFRKMAAAFIYVGLGAVAVFYLFPVGFRLVAIVPVVSGLACLAAAVVIERYHEDVASHGAAGRASEKA